MEWAYRMNGRTLDIAKDGQEVKTIMKADDIVFQSFGGDAILVKSVHKLIAEQGQLSLKTLSRVRRRKYVDNNNSRLI